jgi:hypothetical protein
MTDADLAPAAERWSPPPWTWALLGPIAALVAFHGAFSNSELLYVRDLSMQFWGEHNWLRRELLNGHFPLWDQYMAFGQPAISDPNRGLLFPPTLLLRVVFPVVLGFNLCVAMAFQVLAVGVYLLLKRHVSPPAAAFGSVAFVLSGPSVSLGNFMNFPWAFAFVPWALYAADLLAERVTARRFAGLAVTFALLFLAGESATLVAGTTLTVLYAGVAASAAATMRDRVRALVAVGAAGVVSVLLAAVQLFPLLETIGLSLRSIEANHRIHRFWSLNAITLVDAVAPQLLGNPVAPFAAGEWTRPLNGGREPLMLSIYLGVGVLGLALLGSLAWRRHRVALFWVVVACVSVVMAIGDNLPVYPTLQRFVPLLTSVRYPSKYIVFAGFAIAILAALGWEVLASGRLGDGRRVALRLVTGVFAAFGLVGLVLSIWASVAPGSLEAAIVPLANALGIGDPPVAATFMTRSLQISAPRLFALSLGCGGCVWMAAVRPDPRPFVLLFGFVALDLFFANSNLLPTVDASYLGRPEWVDVVDERPDERTYVAGRLSPAFTSGSTVDLPYPEKGPGVTDLPLAADVATGLVFLASFPSAWQVRDSFSYDNSLLFPRQYWDASLRLARSSRDERVRFLSRAGVRYYLIPWEELDGATVRLTFPDRQPLKLYERSPAFGRASVVPAARVEANEPEQWNLLFGADFDPAAEVLLAEPSTGPTGAVSAPGPPSAAIVVDGAETVSVQAYAPDGGGYVLLLDSFDPNWVAEVDGEPAPVLRANMMFRAVHVSPGAHVVQFNYRPRRLWIGAGVSGTVMLVLLILCLRRRRQAE